ncbi:MAG: ABC transporter permease subunit [Anaerosomatales bacterium]|nr:ABC transporter permease subunit [Anaerosomatales bacterium]MDT8433289.1 ABC transporter permease subunit [Anaerosomatales bacterium]
MRGLGVLLGKEFTEILRTWRLYVVPGILIFFGISSPILAELTPQLLSSMPGLAEQGVSIEIPPATTVDAYLQFNKNAMQIALIAVIIATAGAIAGERSSGTAQIVLAKPVSRTAMVVAKALSSWGLILVAVAVASLLCAGVTALIFDTDLLPEFAGVVGLWYVLAMFLVALTLFFSAALGSSAGAAGAGIAAYFTLTIGSLWETVREFTPVGLLGAGDRIIMGATDIPVVWPVITGLAGAFALVGLAAVAFGRKEL